MSRQTETAPRRTRVRIQTWPTSRHSRMVLRRNYRWMREDGVSAPVARLVITSTIEAHRDDSFMASMEATR
jgi:hypothetical protein